MIINIDNRKEKSKFLQIVDSITNAISSGELKVGTNLPSINQVIKEYGVSRDTVFKAYSELKKRGMVKSVQNKGYYVTSNEKKVFMLLDTMKAYKEVLYGEFHKNIPENYSHSIQFHHYDLRAFKNFIDEALGNYSKYIIMPFDNPDVKKILKKLPEDKLLILDWKTNDGEWVNALYQDFGKSFYDCLEEGIEKIKKYDECIMLYPEFTNHPHESVDYFIKFCNDNNIRHHVEYKYEDLNVEKGKLYISVSDRMLGWSLEQAEEKGLTFGKDIGFISYNETPMKPFINNGITVISTCFRTLGRKSAEFVENEEEGMNFQVPTRLTIRKSL